jgi:hypothetical protein
MTKTDYDPDRSLVLIEGLSHFLTHFLQNLASCHNRVIQPLDETGYNTHNSAKKKIWTDGTKNCQLTPLPHNKGTRVGQRNIKHIFFLFFVFYICLSHVQRLDGFIDLFWTFRNFDK